MIVHTHAHAHTHAAAAGAGEASGTHTVTEVEAQYRSTWGRAFDARACGYPTTAAALQVCVVVLVAGGP
jgi:hypothetical protein